MQHALALHEATLKVEAPRVARSHATLVSQTRRLAGAEIRRSWTLPPVSLDDSPSITDIDLSALGDHDRAYLLAVADYVAMTPWRLRVAARLARHPMQTIKEHS